MIARGGWLGWQGDSLMNSKTYDEIMRMYERDRDRGKRELEARRAEVYRSIPRVAEIERELGMFSTNLASLILKKPADEQKVMKELRSVTEELINEKRLLLRNSRFGANYLNPVYKCPVCEDTGYEHGYGAKCACFKRKAIEMNYTMSNLGAELEKENFSTFNMKFYSNAPDESGVSAKQRIEISLETAKDFVKRFGTGQDPKNLFLHGSTGQGKTFLCNCIAKALLDRGKGVLYQTATDIFKMLDKLRFGRGSREEMEDFEQTLTDVDLLIIDDLGTEFVTLPTQSDLFSVLNTRLRKDKSIVISTNLSLPEFHSQYSERIVSRFLGYFEVMEFKGTDIRLFKKYGEAVNSKEPKI
jgi:DNA replication protein DnaC